MSIDNGNPIAPFEWTYWIALLMLVMCLLTMKFLKQDLLPIPSKIRLTYIIRCVVGTMCNHCFLLSLQFISFSKASVLFWTSPVFTALAARYVLNERLSYYDWGAVGIAFFGILMIQNPFKEKDLTQDDTNILNDMIGTTLAITGAVLGSCVAISIRTITTHAKLHFMVVPMGWVLGNLFLNPLLMTFKVLSTTEQMENMITDQTAIS